MLGATHVLSMTVQREGQSVRALPQLLTSSDGRIVWTTTVPADAASMFSIQDIIVTKVVEELAPRLAPSARTTLASAGTRNPLAYDAYLRGRALVGSPNGDHLSKAAEFFDQAVTLDSRYADAWAGLGSAYKRLPIVAGKSPDLLARARDAALQARRIVPDHAEAISVLGTVAFWYDWDYERAESLLRHALKLHSSSADSQVFLAHLLSNLGRFDEAIVEIRRARAFDDKWAVPRALEGQFRFMARDYDGALKTLDETLEVHPDFWPAHLFRIWTLAALGRYDEALLACERHLRMRPEPEGSGLGALPMKGYVLARRGRLQEAQEVLAQVREQKTNPAVLLHALKRDDEALEALRGALEARSLSVTFLGVDPRWDDMREVPAFREVLRSAGLLHVSDAIRRLAQRRRLLS
jgi:tetratricopeptide (TPR) repeat protein